MSIHVLVISSKDQLEKYKKKIQKDTGVRQKESLTEQIIAEQKETNKLLDEQKVFYAMTLNIPSSIQSTDNWDGKISKSVANTCSSNYFTESLKYTY